MGFVLIEIPGVSLTYHHNIPDKETIYNIIFTFLENNLLLGQNLSILGDGFGTILMTQFLKYISIKFNQKNYSISIPYVL